MAFGKHLCGAATDFTLRSCARERRRQLGLSQQQGQAAVGQEQQQAAGQQRDAAAAAAGAGAAAAGAAAAAVVDPPRGGPIPAAGGVRGLAVATCCHHRCSWRHFVAQGVFTELGFSPQEFEAIVWMTGWALVSCKRLGNRSSHACVLCPVWLGVLLLEC